MYANRSQGHRLTQAHLFGDDGPRHVLGLLPRSRGHVICQVSAQAHRIPRCSAKLQTRHRSSHAGHEFDQEGLLNSSLESDSQTADVKRSGSRLYCADHDSPSDHRPTSLHYSLSRSLYFIRLITATHLQQPIYKEENNSYTIQISARLPGDPEGSMAQDQRPPHGPRGRPQRDCCDCQRCLRTRMETAERLSTSSTEAVRASRGGR